MPKKVAIDLGTSNTTVFLGEKGVVLREPTVVAVSEEDNKIVAIGTNARDMLGKTPEGVLAVMPLRSGVVAEYSYTEVLLRYFIDKVIGRSRLFRPDVIVSVPVGATSVESRAVLDAVYAAGIHKAFLVPSPLAAALGAGLPVSEPSGNMLVSIGGGITEMAVVSMYGMVTHGSARVGGNDLDQCVAQYLRRQYGLVIGENTAESVKINAGSAIPSKDVQSLEVKGRDSVSGFPKIVSVSSEEISDSLLPVLSQMALSIKNVLEKTPPELSSDIVDKGFVLSGGSALLKNIDRYMSNYVGVPVHVADESALCTVKGLGFALEDLQPFSKSMIS